jgi:hypothetical protein
MQALDTLSTAILKGYRFLGLKSVRQRFFIKNVCHIVGLTSMGTL